MLGGGAAASSDTDAEALSARRRSSLDSLAELRRSQAKHEAMVGAHARKRRCTITKSGWLQTGTIAIRHKDDKEGGVFYKPVKWKRTFFVLSNNTLTVHKSEDQSESAGRIPLTPDSMVHDTTLHPHAFQLVTPFVAIHVCAETPEEKHSWTQLIHTEICSSTFWQHLPPRIVAAALALIDDTDSLYEVFLPTKKPLDVVLRNTGELVEVCDAKPTSGIFVGSFLSRMQGQSVISRTYSEVIEQLSHWEPPMTLELRTPPGLEGTLRKRSGRFLKGWDTCHFALERGALFFYPPGQAKANARKFELQVRERACPPLTAPARRAPLALLGAHSHTLPCPRAPQSVRTTARELHCVWCHRPSSAETSASRSRAGPRRWYSRLRPKKLSSSGAQICATRSASRTAGGC